jgi:hypothetical protein
MKKIIVIVVLLAIGIYCLVMQKKANDSVSEEKKPLPINPTALKADEKVAMSQSDIDSALAILEEQKVIKDLQEQVGYHGFR